MDEYTVSFQVQVKTINNLKSWLTIFLLALA
jgi:hypothetical protein